MQYYFWSLGSGIGRSQSVCTVIMAASRAVACQCGVKQSRRYGGLVWMPENVVANDIKSIVRSGATAQAHQANERSMSATSGSQPCNRGSIWCRVGFITLLARCYSGQARYIPACSTGLRASTLQVYQNAFFLFVQLNSEPRYCGLVAYRNVCRCFAAVRSKTWPRSCISRRASFEPNNTPVDTY
jgi:hypothetical protein